MTVAFPLPIPESWLYLANNNGKEKARETSTLRDDEADKLPTQGTVGRVSGPRTSTKAAALIGVHANWVFTSATLQ